LPYAIIKNEALNCRRSKTRTVEQEAAREAHKADVAQHAKEQAQQSREALEEKMKT
jgi:DNA-directed RNA polymerase specialized sigma24 family protein